MSDDRQAWVSPNGVIHLGRAARPCFTCGKPHDWHAPYAKLTDTLATNDDDPGFDVWSALAALASIEEETWGA